MAEDTRGNSLAIHGKWALFVPTLFLAAGITIASAQCSQETRPEAAPSPQNISAAALGGETSSSIGAPNTVRFATGNAVTVLEDTPLQVVNDMPISSRTNREGATLSFTVTRDVVIDGVLVIPCGAKAVGTIVAAKQAGRLAGGSNLTLELTALNPDGRSYPLYTPPFKVVGQSKTRPTATKMAAGATVGALVAEANVPTTTTPYVGSRDVTVTGKIPAADQARGVAIVAGVGAGVGAAIAAGSPPSIALIPAESQIEFTLASPIAVYPVDQRTAARLALGLHRGGPALYLRGENQ